MMVDSNNGHGIKAEYVAKGLVNRLPLGAFGWLVVLLLGFILPSSFCIPPTPHPLHIGVTELDYNTRTKRFEAAHKLFMDDLDDALAATQERNCGFFEAQQHPKCPTVLAAYINQRFQVQTGAQVLSFRYVGFEKTGDKAVWVYLESDSVGATPRQLNIRNELLMHVFDDQRNLVHLSVGTWKRSLSFDAAGTVQRIVVQ